MDTSLPVAPISLPPEPHYRPVKKGAWSASVLGVGAAFGAGAFLAAQMAFGAAGFIPLLGAYGALIAWSVDRRRKMVDCVRENDDAVALLNAGDVAKAESTFEHLIRKSRANPGYNALFVYNRGVAFLRRGEFDRAISLFHAVLDSGWLNSSRMPFRPLLFSGLATAHALRGDLHAAQHWLHQAHATVSHAKRGALLLADAIVAVRTGRPRDALAMMDAGWAQAEGVLSAIQVRTLRLLRAFAMEQLPPAPGLDEEIQRQLLAVRPFPPGAYDYVGASWPEFAHFLRRHGLTSY